MRACHSADAYRMLNVEDDLKLELSDYGRHFLAQVNMDPAAIEERLKVSPEFRQLCTAVGWCGLLACWCVDASGWVSEAAGGSGCQCRGCESTKPGSA